MSLFTTEDVAALETRSGSCLCGEVRFIVSGPLPHADACHCVACRKQSGHFWVSSDVPRGSLQLLSEATLKWFHSSEKVRRGFCERCGSSLFWDALGREKIAIALGAIDGATHSALALHIFVAEKGDYYTLCDGLTQHA